MATIRKEIVVDAQPDAVWDAVRDVGAIHTRLAPGFVTDTRLDGDTRTVTFANGVVAKERIVTVDDNERRLVWAIVEGRLTHHNGAIQVFVEGDHRSRILWTADLLPNELAPQIDGMMTMGMATIQKTLGTTLA